MKKYNDLELTAMFIKAFEPAGVVHQVESSSYLETHVNIYVDFSTIPYPILHDLIKHLKHERPESALEIHVSIDGTGSERFKLCLKTKWSDLDDELNVISRHLDKLTYMYW